MCKILCYTSHDPAKRDKLITNAWSKMICEYDGFGAAWFGADGQIGYHKRSGKTLYHEAPPSFVRKKSVQGWVKPTFAESNDIPSDGGFLIIHGRRASPQSLVNVHNTHPMLSPGAALVHNGIVFSTKHGNTAPCSCDSELLLKAYIEGGLPEIEEQIWGYYAFMALILDEANEKTLHIAKDSRADLHCGIMLSDKSYVFGTTEDLVKSTGAEPMGEFENNTSLIFTSKTDFIEGTFVPQVFTADDKTKKAATESMGPSEDDGYDNWMAERHPHNHHVTQGSSQYPQQSGTQSMAGANAIELQLKEIDRLEREAIDDRIYELPVAQS